MNTAETKDINEQTSALAFNKQAKQAIWPTRINTLSSYLGQLSLLTYTLQTVV